MGPTSNLFCAELLKFIQIEILCKKTKIENKTRTSTCNKMKYRAIVIQDLEELWPKEQSLEL